MNSYNSTHTGQQLDRAIDFMLSHEDIIRLSKEEIVALVQAKIEELRSITNADAIEYTVDETVKDALDRVIKDGMKSIELKPRTDGKQGFYLVVENLNGRKINSGFEIDNYASNIRFDGTLAGIPEDNVEGAINRLATNVNKNKDDLSELSRQVDEIVGVDVKAYSYSVAGEGVEIRKTLTVGTTWSDTALTTRNAHNVLRADISDASGEIEIAYCRTYVEGVPAIAIVSNDNVVLGLLYPSEIKKNFTISFNVNDYKGAKYVYSGYYSTLTPSVVQKAVVGQVDKKIAPIKADVSKLALLRLGNWFYGKKVAIIGDSISTFNAEGYKYADYATYYPSATHAQDVKEVTDTWWKKVLDSVDASLAVNLAYSGSMVSNYRTITYGTYPSLCDRIPLIGDVDTLIIALGTNDSRNAKNVPLGEYDYDAEIIDETKFRTAYIGGIKKACEQYNSVKIICVILDMLTAYADSIKEIAKHYGLPCIDCRGYTMSDDAPHPNKQGMEDIAHLFLSATPYASAGGSSSENSEDVVINQKKGKNLINAYIKQDGTVTTSTSWDSYKINNFGYKKLNFKVNNLLSYASYPYIAVGFYSSKDPSAKSLMDESITFENYTSGTELSVEIPDGCKTIVVANRTQNGDASVSVVADLSILFESIDDNSSKDVKFEHNGLTILSSTKTTLWSQAAICIDNYIYGFTASDADRNTYGKIRKIDKNSFPNSEVLKVINHMFGHCNTVDYHYDSDTLITTHYIDNDHPDNIQGIYLVKQFKEKLEMEQVEDVGLLISGLSFVTGSLMGACYGESSDIVYLCSFIREYSEHITRYFYKVVMGKGSNNLSAVENGYGTFISGCPENEYNGTLKLIGTWEGSWYGEIQGMKYLNGHIIVSTDIRIDGILTPYISKVKLNSDGKAELVNNLWIQNFDENREYWNAEAEGFAFDGQYGYIVTMPKDKPDKTKVPDAGGTFKFPLACL